MADAYRVNLSGLAAVKRHLAAPLCEAVALVLRDKVVETMENAPPRTGETYLVPSTKTPYVASAPGEPPAIREDRYAGSWKSTPGVPDGGGASAHAYSDLETEDGEHLIGAILEYGAPKVPIEPRPHIRNAIQAAEPDIRALVRQASR